MYRKAVCSYFSTINSVLECFMTQEICDQVVDVYFLVFDSIPDRYKTQQMREKCCLWGFFFDFILRW